VNDEFLYRLRQPPPAALAARLRARLESQALTRRFHRRQITLYSLLACLLGSTALAWVVPGVRETTSAMIREVLPESIQELLETRTRQPLPAMWPMEPAAPEPVDSTTQTAASGPPGVTHSMVAVFPPRPPERVQPATPKVAYVAGGRTAQPAPVESRPLTQLKLIGTAQTAAALNAAISEFQDLNGDVRIVLAPATNNKAFSRFCSGEGDIALATRMITQSELETCRRSGADITALPIAYEALVVLGHSLNDWVGGLRRADLKLLFNGGVQPNLVTWSLIDQRWPATVVDISVPRPGAKPADTFSELVLGVTPAERFAAAFAGNEEMRLLQRVQRSLNGLAYVPYPTYLEAQQRASVRVIAIVNESGAAVAPSRASIADGSYELARPLLLFVRRRADRVAAAEDFIELALNSAERRLARSPFLSLSRAETRLAAIVLRGLGEMPPLEPSSMWVRSAREILLQQLPPDRREQARLKLDSN
jgi:phosphate transport system substrate-binding protein